jgi:ABC-2 type transport system permease protein
MKRYLSLYASFIRVGFIADMEYRANFISRVVTDIFWYAAQIIAFEVLFNHAPQIAGWDRAKTRVFLGLLFMVDALFMIAFSDNMERLGEKVRKGDLDLLLVKPINSQFMVSLQKVSTSLVMNFILACCFFAYAFSTLPEANALRLLWLLILVPCGLVSIYAFRFIVAATSIIFTKADNMQFMWYQFYRLGMRPDSIYQRWLRLFILSLVPVAMVGSVPARFIVGEPDFYLLAWTILWSSCVLWISHLYWNFALKHYSSASS